VGGVVLVLLAGVLELWNGRLLSKPFLALVKASVISSCVNPFFSKKVMR
jgi:hypothetical protein